MVRLLLVVLPLIALAGCKTQSDLYCDTHPGVCSAGDDGGKACPTECTDTTPVCNTDKGMCTQCFAKDPKNYCTGMTPHCDVDTCTACVDDTDCPNSVCMTSGGCADPTSIIHVTATSTKMDSCGDMGDPCSLTGALMIAMMPPPSNKNIIKLDDGGTYASDPGFSVNADVTIDARDATLRRNMPGPILEIKSNRIVTLIGGTIQGAIGGNGDGILCNSSTTLTVALTTINSTEKSGINALSGCNLTVTQATISNTSMTGGQLVAAILDNGDSIELSRSKIISNRGGGLAVKSGTFNIAGNAFLDNGSDTSTTGGITIATSSNTSNRANFNTISHNNIQDGVQSGGIDCNAGTGLAGYYNIVWNNKSNTTGMLFSQISGGCKHTYSDVGPTSILSLNDGMHNFNSDPLLQNEQSDFHLKPSSPAHQYADPAADLSGLAEKDIDGDKRISPADIGADQTH